MRSKFNVTKWVRLPIDSHPFHSMSISPPIPGIWIFQNLIKSKVKVIAQDHKVDLTSVQLKSLSRTGPKTIIHPVTPDDLIMLHVMALIPYTCLGTHITVPSWVQQHLIAAMSRTCHVLQMFAECTCLQSHRKNVIRVLDISYEN